MERTNLIEKLNFFKGLTIIYTVGFIGHMINPLREYMFMLTPFVLLLSGIIILSNPILNKNWKLLTWVAVCGILTFILEAVGVATGEIFGPYFYEEVLGLKLFDVPIIISFNWVIVIYGAISCSKIIFKNQIFAWLFSSLLPVIFDYILEPVAVKFDYWEWETSSIPLQNYIAWFLISLAMTGIFFLLKLEDDKKLPAYYFVLLIIYFSLIRIFI